MSEVRHDDYTTYTLPSSIVTKRDIAHLVDEAEAIDRVITSNSVRSKAGVAGELHHEASGQMEEFLTVNQIDMGQSSGVRTEIIRQLRKLKDKSPVIHLTFATRVDPESLGELVDWLRQNVERQAVVSIGLQPGLVGGVHIRTVNNVHDLSLRKILEKHRDVLVKEVEALGVQN